MATTEDRRSAGLQARTSFAQRDDESAPEGARSRLFLFFAQEYQRIMRGRAALVLWAFVLYAIVIVPFILDSPQEELIRSLASWLGGEDISGKLILFAWVDGAMNKLAFIIGPVLAGGIIVDEKARGSYDLFLSKPIGAGDYFVVKLAAAGAALATFYLGAVVGALLTFPWRVEGFSVADYLALSAVHVFAALFAVSFSGAAAVIFRNRTIAILFSIMVLGILVGFAFFAFAAPAYRGMSQFNPFFHGVVLIGSLDHYGPLDILRPILVLIGFNLATIAIGRWRAIALVEGS